jgi:cytochrome c peroxidase
MLSLDTSIACGSCHQQVFAFTNGPSHNVSHGVHDLLGKRNSPALFNLTWMPKMMWDGGVSNIENQPIAPIENPVEFNMNLAEAVKRIASSPKYQALCKKAYGDTIINSQRILKSLAQFLGLLVSYNSKYDKVKRGEAAFGDAENAGYSIFKNKCNACHTEPLFTDHSFRNKGLPPNAYQDSGRYRITLSSLDIYRFKVPSLRNLNYTAPYMHDGRFQTLDDVFDFYVSGIANTVNLDPYLTQGHTLSTQERSNLLAFLATLNDSAFVKDPRFREIH